ncbi:MAG: CRISPR-associated helicase/endonuclease Cas3 [Candidatus Neomarinimicrobiota bacterium]
MKDRPAYYRYWGKAEKDSNGYHLLPYHCLDVAAVGQVWWQQSQIIRNRFTAISSKCEKEVFAWTMFFIVLHDLGKFDVRFQLKLKDIAYQLWNEFRNADASQSFKYWHGDYTGYWIFHDLNTLYNWNSEFNYDDRWEAWQVWVFAIAGHHGIIPTYLDGNISPADKSVIEHDAKARLEFIGEMEALFLKPANLSLYDIPPVCDSDFLAGFCSVCDWLGSTQFNVDNEERFRYQTQHMALNEYFLKRIPIAEKVFRESGLLRETTGKSGMQGLYPKFTPHLVQTLVDELPVTASLTIIEAPTGSGKTEAALAYASRLLQAGVVDNIVFALPTQATANAMFDRLMEVADNIYSTSNLLLAHGKARFNERFMDLKKAAKVKSPQDREHELEATIQCSQWLAQSRKRIFLGQIGVCTIDQVLISVLPVRHKFVRSFGLGKSVLIVDEVHAYDSYMYGLLECIITKQRQFNSAAILLSATLPSAQRNNLINAWGVDDESGTDASYPLITSVAGGKQKFFTLSKNERIILDSTGRNIVIEIDEQLAMRFQVETLLQVIQAASTGANVVIICNLVADAQATVGRLIELGSETLDIFHSRFRFKDRQSKENKVIREYGKGDLRKQGGILVATPVVEQSLDLDFDWMLTQLCPIDLLFQRLGRLHRHERKRPAGFERPRCAVVIPPDNNYELHKLIYGSKNAPNSRILWRTEQLLRQNKELRFPDVYRPMIENVYNQSPWQNEPTNIREEYERFEMEQEAIRATAWQLMNSNPNFEDSDSKAALLTRDGEMNLNVVPVTGDGRSRAFLDGKFLAGIEEYQLAEEISLNSIPIPATWKHLLPVEQDGIIWLTMVPVGDGIWQAEYPKTTFSYTISNGLERKDQ